MGRIVWREGGGGGREREGEDALKCRMASCSSRGRDSGLLQTGRVQLWVTARRGKGRECRESNEISDRSIFSSACGRDAALHSPPHYPRHLPWIHRWTREMDSSHLEEWIVKSQGEDLVNRFDGGGAWVVASFVFVQRNESVERGLGTFGN